MKVYVIQGNDFPESVVSDGQKARDLIHRRNTQERVQTGRSRIYWSVYPFELDEVKPDRNGVS